MSTSEFCLRFDPGQIAELPAGDIHLGVPTYNDVIQIGDFKTQSRSAIVVSTEEGGLTTVSRGDGKLLEVEIVEETSTGIKRLPVFEAPLDQISFRPDFYRGHIFWFAQGDEKPLLITEPARFEALVLTIGSYAMMKSRRLQQSGIIT